MAGKIVLLGKWYYPRFDGGCRGLRLFGVIGSDKVWRGDFYFYVRPFCSRWDFVPAPADGSMERAVRLPSQSACRLRIQPNGKKPSQFVKVFGEGTDMIGVTELNHR